MFLVPRFMWGYAATHDDCGSLKGNHEKSGKCPCGFLKTHSKASGTACSLRSPLAAAVASCPSIREGKGWVGGGSSRYMENLTLNTARRCLDGALIMLVICWNGTGRSQGAAHSQASCTDNWAIHVRTRERFRGRNRQHRMLKAETICIAFLQQGIYKKNLLQLYSTVTCSFSSNDQSWTSKSAFAPVITTIVARCCLTRYM